MSNGCYNFAQLIIICIMANEHLKVAGINLKKRNITAEIYDIVFNKKCDMERELKRDVSLESAVYRIIKESKK